MRFCEVFKMLRKEKGLTQIEMAEALGISRSAVGMYENGQREPDFEVEEKIADFFNVSLDYLRTGTHNFRLSDEKTKQQSEKPITVKVPRISPEKFRLVDIGENAAKEDRRAIAQDLVDRAFNLILTDFEWKLLEHYRAADPGTQAAVRKLLDMEDSTMPVAAHPVDGAPLEGQMEDAKMVDKDD